MERTFKLILPAMDNAGDPIRTDLLEQYVRDIAQHFGGATVYPVAAGCYLMGEQLQCDQNIIIEATRPDADASTIASDTRWLEALAGQAGRQLGQESIFDQEERATETIFVPGHFQPSLPPSEIDPFRKHRSPQEVFRDLLP